MQVEVYLEHNIETSKMATVMAAMETMMDMLQMKFSDERVDISRPN